MPDIIRKFLKSLIVVLIPIFLVLGSVRLLATDTYLAFEYSKASFPPDLYGFTPQQRFELASTNIHYVRAHLPGDTLSRQTLDGKSVYNAREVSHMADVQAVFKAVLRVWQITLVLLLFSGFVFWKSREQRAFSSALRSGGLFTSGIILAIGLMAFFAWDTWFELFHRFFFVPGSWLFSYTDTLIRLFPFEFWYDATLTISALGFVSGSLLALLGWRGQISMVKNS